MPGAFAKVLSYGVYGIEPYQVTVELDVTITAKETEPQSIFQIVGLPEGAVKESRERVRAAIGNAGFWFPVRFDKLRHILKALDLVRIK